MSKPYREQVQAAIHALGEMSSAEFQQHIADGSVPVTQWTTEQRARWTAVDDRLRPLIEAWVQADDEDDPQQVWVEVLSHVMQQRDLALARVRELGEAQAKAAQERATLDRVRAVAMDAYTRAHRAVPVDGWPGRCGCIACRVTEVLR